MCEKIKDFASPKARLKKLLNNTTKNQIIE